MTNKYTSICKILVHLVAFVIMICALYFLFFSKPQLCEIEKLTKQATDLITAIDGVKIPEDNETEEITYKIKECTCDDKADHKKQLTEAINQLDKVIEELK